MEPLKQYKSDVGRNASNKELLDKISNLKLEGYYPIDDEINFERADLETVKKLFEDPKFVTYSEVDDEFYVIDDDAENGRKILSDNYFKTFDGSNRWMSDKLIPVQDVFPNSTIENINVEQDRYYCCLVVAATMGGSFKKQFFEQCEMYDFNVWSGPKNLFGGDDSFQSLYELWFSTSSRKIKMIFSAAKYAISLQKNDASLIYTTNIPQDVALKLVKLRNTLSGVRYKYETGELSPQAKIGKTKLDIKILYKKMDDEVNHLLKEDIELYQLHKLYKLGGSEISADDINVMRCMSRKQVIDDVREGRFPEDIDGKMLKAISEKIFKNLKNSYLSKFRAEEFIKYNELGADYEAPRPQ